MTQVDERPAWLIKTHRWAGIAAGLLTLTIAQTTTEQYPNLGKWMCSVSFVAGAFCWTQYVKKKPEAASSPESERS